MLIKAGLSEFSLPCLSAEEFPDFEEGKHSCEFEITSSDLHYLIATTKHAISYDETRYYLSGVFLHVTEDNGVNVLRAVATDVHRLAIGEVTLPKNAQLLPEIIIPKKTVFELTKLLENCIDLKSLDETKAVLYRDLYITKLLYLYGGINLEKSFITFKSLKPIYEKIIQTGKISSAEFEDKTINSRTFSPSIKLLGCSQKCEKMRELCDYIYELINKNSFGELLCKNPLNEWLYENLNSINYIDGKYIGTKDINNNLVTLDNLMSSTYLDLDSDIYCLYIPHNELKIRSKYNWFIYLNTNEALKTNTNISKYLLLANNLK